MPTLNFTVNGKPVSVDVKPNEFLAEVLRYKLGLTGTKIGCNEAECGICTVIVDGQSVVSCIYPAVKAEGAHVETIEGLANGQLHLLQENFIKHGAVQCGFCTPGLIMQSKALLDKKQGQPVTDEEIKIALKDTYCRCTGYVSVMNAIKSANGQPIELVLPETKHGLQRGGRSQAARRCRGESDWRGEIRRRHHLPRHAVRRDAARHGAARADQEDRYEQGQGLGRRAGRVDTRRCAGTQESRPGDHRLAGAVLR